MSRWSLLMAVACLACTASARGGGNKQCPVTINCFYLDPRDATNKGKPGWNPAGTFDPTMTEGCEDGKCREGETSLCLYGRDSVESCPSRPGPHDIMCQCVSQELARGKNEETKKTIVAVGWVFFVLSIIVPLIGAQMAKCVARGREQREQQMQTQLQCQQQMMQSAAAQPQQLSVTVPAGMQPGQMLQVANPSAGGALTQVTIPAGVPPGGTFLVSVPAAPVPVVQPAPTPVGSFATASAPTSQMVVMPSRKAGVEPGVVGGASAPHMPGLVGASAPQMSQPVTQPVALPTRPPMQPQGYQGQRACCCCAPSAQCEKFFFIFLPLLICGLVAIGCLAGGYNYDLDKFWNGCGSRKVDC